MYLKKYNLKNKTALVTGAGKGLGRACAIALAEAGTNLIIISRTEKDLKEVSKIIKKFRVNCKYFVCDVTKYEQIKKVINSQKRIDVVVNNAGTNIPEHFTKVKKSNMEYLVKVNTIASFNIAQLSALKMIELKTRKKTGGVIINMSSQMGHVGGPIRSVYNMNKFGLEGLTKGMSIDLAKYNIRVNTICPTFVVTPMTKKFLKDKKFMKEVLGNIPLGKFAELSDIASAVVFLASDQADGDFVFGLDRDRKNDVVIVKTFNGNKTKIVKKVIKREYKIQRIDGLEPKKVTPPKEVYARIKKENKLIVRAREINSNLKFFKNKFIAPLDDAIITGIYGSQRILNGKPRSPHYGIDFAGKLGTPIKAMANGVVTLAENDLYYTGATLIFDHGHGISTLYMHMDKIFVEEGDIVKQGDIIGTVGSSGRSTGPHLDIRLNWFGIKLDPSTVIDIKL